MRNPDARWMPPQMTAVSMNTRTGTSQPPVYWSVCFDEAWRNTSHPVPLPRGRRCHPDGFVTIRSNTSDRDAVVSIVATLFGIDFRAADLSLFNPAQLSLRNYPLGCLATYDAVARTWNR